MLKLTAFASLVLFVPPTLASIYISNIPTDYYTITTTPGLTIYAGSTINRGLCTGTGCDSCSSMDADFSSPSGYPPAGSQTTCSLKEIHPTDVLTLTLVSDFPGGVPSAPIYMKSPTGLPVAATGSPVFSGSTVQLSIPWSQICATLSYDGSCTTSFPATPLIIGWSKDAGDTFSESVEVNVVYRYVTQSESWTSWCDPAAPSTGAPGVPFEGFCYFTAYPGDSMASIFPSINKNDSYLVPDLQYSSYYSRSSVDPSGMSYSGLAVFYSTDSKKMTTGMPMQVLDWNIATGALQQNAITGLTNGTTYYLAIASIDQAGILSFFSNPASENFSTVAVPPQGNSQAVIPHP